MESEPRFDISKLRSKDLTVTSMKESLLFRTHKS